MTFAALPYDSVRFDRPFAADRPVRPFTLSLKISAASTREGNSVSVGSDANSSGKPTDRLVSKHRKFEPTPPQADTNSAIGSGFRWTSSIISRVVPRKGESIYFRAADKVKFSDL